MNNFFFITINSFSTTCLQRLKFNMCESLSKYFNYKFINMSTFEYNNKKRLVRWKVAGFRGRLLIEGIADLINTMRLSSLNNNNTFSSLQNHHQFVLNSRQAETCNPHEQWTILANVCVIYVTLYRSMYKTLRD